MPSIRTQKRRTTARQLSKTMLAIRFPLGDEYELLRGLSTMSLETFVDRALRQYLKENK